MMPRLLWAAITFSLVLGAIVPAAEERKPAETAYELHEWGVFSVARNDAWAMRDMKEEWASFPAFFNRIWPEKKLPYRGEVSKPVVFFHAAKPLVVDLTVRFAEGRPLVWWPNAESPSWLGGNGLSGKLDRLVFQLHLVEFVKQGNFMPESETPEVEKGHWVEALREVKGVKVITSGGYDGRRGSEKYKADTFLYYDGVMKAPAAPKVSREGDAIVLETALDHAMLDVLAIERREGKTRSAAAFVERIEPGARKTKVMLEAAGDKAVDALAAGLAKRAEAAGLNTAEAASLVKVWREGLFTADGLTVFYRIPQETYDQWLPLEAKPAPKRTVRVGLVLHRHLEPELDARVDALIKQLGSEQFEAREKAQRELAKIGGAAFPALEKAAQGEDVEAAKACRAILNALNAGPALEELKKNVQK